MMSLKEKLSDKLKGLWSAVINGTILTKREVEWNMLGDILLTAFFLILIFSLLLVKTFLISMWWAMAFWLVYALVCLGIYFFWKFSISIILKLLYGNGDDVDENGDEITISRIMEKALKNLEN